MLFNILIVFKILQESETSGKRYLENSRREFTSTVMASTESMKEYTDTEIAQSKEEFYLSQKVNLDEIKSEIAENFQIFNGKIIGIQKY